MEQPVDFERLQYWCCFYFCAAREDFVYSYVGHDEENAKAFQKKYPLVGGYETNIVLMQLVEIKRALMFENLALIRKQIDKLITLAEAEKKS